MARAMLPLANATVMCETLKATLLTVQVKMWGHAGPNDTTVQFVEAWFPKAMLLQHMDRLYAAPKFVEVKEKEIAARYNKRLVGIVVGDVAWVD